jgi:hypothetical protein
VIDVVVRGGRPTAVLACALAFVVAALGCSSSSEGSVGSPPTVPARPPLREGHSPPEPAMLLLEGWAMEVHEQGTERTERRTRGGTTCEVQLDRWRGTPPDPGSPMQVQSRRAVTVDGEATELLEVIAEGGPSARVYLRPGGDQVRLQMRACSAAEIETVLAAVRIYRSPSARPRVAPWPAGPARLQIRLYRGVGMIAGYDYASVVPRLQALAPADAVATLEERDIESYRVAATPSGRVELVLTEAASRRLLGTGRADDVCGEGPFVVLLDGAFLYGGQCYPAMGAAALNYPVAHLDTRDARLVIRIGASQMTWMLAGDPPSAAADVDPAALRTLFEGAGRLGRLEAR